VALVSKEREEGIRRGGKNKTKTKKKTEPFIQKIKY